MAVRRESVQLDLQDNFTTGMARAAAAAALLNRELDTLNNRGRSTQASTVTITNNVSQIAQSANNADSSINKLTGRLRVMADAIAILGPGLIPIAAVGVPAVTGLANSLGAAALAGGVAIAAFQGVGDALTAVNEHQLNPTADTLEKARLAMENLSPAAQDMVAQLQSLRPEMREIRDIAAEGLFPGVSEALDDLQTRLPDVERIFARVAEVSGQLAADTGRALASNDFDNFFTFLATDVPDTLADVARTVGSLASGLADLFIAFDPLNDDFSGWMLDVARSFEGWAEGLAQTEGYADFVNYIRETGPQVADTLGALADAMIQIVQAAAPMGGPVLAAVEALASGIAVIADSDFGPKIVTMVAALALFNRAMAASTAVLARFGIQARGASAAGGFAAVTSRVNAARASVAGFGRDLATIGTTAATAGARTAREAARMAAAQQRVAQTAGRVAGATARASAITAGFALVTSDSGRELGLQNTAMLGLMGTMAGPYGAAVGLAAGAALDGAAANDAFSDALERAENLIRQQPTALLDQAAAVQQVRSEYQTFAEEMTRTGFGFGVAKNQIEDLFGRSDVEEAREATRALVAEQEDLQRTYSNLVNEVRGNSLSQAFASDFLGAEGGRGGFTDFTRDLEELERLSNRLQPALEELGYSAEELANMDVGSSEWERATDAVADYLKQQDSVEGRTQGVRDAIGGIGDELLSTAESADQLAAALDELLSPQLNAEEATHAYRESLAGLSKELKNADAGFSGFTKRGRENAALTRDFARSTTEMLSAQAEAGASARQLAGLLREARVEFINEGVAAGFSRDQMRARADTIGLTPKLVRTVFKEVGLEPITAKAQDLTDRLNKLPDEVRTNLVQRGFPESAAQVEALQKKYDLTPKEVRTILEARDNASVTIDRVTGKAKAVPQSTNTDLNAVDRASGTIGAVAGALANLNGRTATTYVRTVRLSPTRAASELASGGYVAGPGTATSDSIPAWLSNGEYVIRAAAVERYGKSFFDRLNAQAFANGGLVTGGGNSTITVRLSDLNVSGAVDTGSGMAIMRGVARAEAQQVVIEAEKDRNRRARAGARS